MPFHDAHHERGWEPDPLILDDQALVANVRGRGLVVLTGCGHAGAVNICRYARRLTRCQPTGRFVRRAPPHGSCLRTDHRADGDGLASARPADRRAGPLHRLASPAPPRRRAARSLHPQRGRNDHHRRRSVIGRPISYPGEMAQKAGPDPTARICSVPRAPRTRFPIVARVTSRPTGSPLIFWHRRVRVQRPLGWSGRPFSSRDERRKAPGIAGSAYRELLNDATGAGR